MLAVEKSAQALTFRIVVQPKSSRNQACGLLGDALKLKITAPPVEGAANQACIEFLAKALGVPKSRLAIVSGHTGRRKRIRVEASPQEQPRLTARLRGLAG